MKKTEKSFQNQLLELNNQVVQFKNEAEALREANHESTNQNN